MKARAVAARHSSCILPRLDRGMHWRATAAGHSAPSSMVWIWGSRQLEGHRGVEWCFLLLPTRGEWIGLEREAGFQSRQTPADFAKFDNNILHSISLQFRLLKEDKCYITANIGQVLSLYCVLMYDTAKGSKSYMVVPSLSCVWYKLSVMYCFL
jgi:hypothetical protein